MLGGVRGAGWFIVLVWMMGGGGGEGGKEVVVDGDEVSGSRVF